jgi:hypothetical protein
MNNHTWTHHFGHIAHFLQRLSHMGILVNFSKKMPHIEIGGIS